MGLAIYATVNHWLAACITLGSSLGCMLFPVVLSQVVALSLTSRARSLSHLARALSLSLPRFVGACMYMYSTQMCVSAPA
jgi:hypothetical protein